MEIGTRVRCNVFQANLGTVVWIGQGVVQVHWDTGVDQIIPASDVLDAAIQDDRNLEG